MAQISTLKLLLTGVAASLLLLLGIIVGQHQPASTVLGSEVGNVYVATTTSAFFGSPVLWSLTATSSTDISSHPGEFGGIIVTTTGTAGGNMDFYDATTTDVTKRATSMATSSILITSIPLNLTAGSYPFGVQVKYGIIVVRSGTQGTTTITYRIDH